MILSLAVKLSKRVKGRNSLRKLLNILYLLRIHLFQVKQLPKVSEKESLEVSVQLYGVVFRSMKGFSVLNHLFRSKYNLLFIRFHYSDRILSLHCFFVCPFFCFLLLKRVRVQFWLFFLQDIGGKRFILKEKIFLLVEVHFLFALFEKVKLVQVLA